jgi:predicted dehydrogenase
VVVCTPPALHAAQALAVLEAGAAALVEKPLCTTLDDADRLVAAGGQLAYAENLLHAPVVQLARTHVAQLEAIDLIEVRALQSRPTWGDFLTEAWGGGALFDVGPHPIAVGLVFAAPARPVEVRAVLRGADDHPVDEHAEVTVQLDTGGQLRIVASWAHAGSPTWDAQVSSPDGVVRMELVPHLLLERNGAEVRLPESQGPLVDLGYAAQLRSFVDDVRRGTPPGVGAAFGRAVLDVICAAYASAGAGGEWVALPFEGPRDLTPLQLWRA